MIRFFKDEALRVVGTRLVYRERDYSFAAERRPANGGGSVVVNTVELPVDGETGQVLCVEGYCPHHAWKPAQLSTPTAMQSALRVAGVEFRPGVAIELNPPANNWPIHVDVSTGWLCLGNRHKTAEGIEFAPGCIAVLQGDSLVSLWLHPGDLPQSLDLRDA